ncbi:hypothetical protein [Oceaniglobus trochenteri]|uniref:hypothetical protein n=1 Tax=Oceaniglobus trochenteri TaxID=2763260 RepID=UPI001CFF9C85|nr:hypothetical protein [Oceaniglobus trochenteri]
MQIERPRLIAYGIGLLIVAVFVAANAHLVTVSLSSQPGCALVQPSKEGAVFHRPAKPSC